MSDTRKLAATGSAGVNVSALASTLFSPIRSLALRRASLSVASVVIFLGGWQLVASGLNPILLPTPSAVLDAFITIVQEGTLLPAFARALEVLAVGFALSAVTGIALGIVMGRSDAADRVLTPYVNFFQATPLIGLVPLIVIWFGIGFESEVAVTFVLAVWSIIINTSEGIRTTPGTLLDMARIYHASERSVVRNIAVPHAVPFIFAGLRIALAKALIGVIIAEMDVSLKGLGGLIQNFGDAFQTAALMAAIVTSSMVGVFGTVLLEMLRRRLAPWAAPMKTNAEL
jgi:NitT/TauT family transport system permease protein